MSALSELSSHNSEILVQLRMTDLDNFLTVLEDPEKMNSIKLFQPLFTFPDDIDVEIPTVEILFDNSEFSCEVIK